MSEQGKDNLSRFFRKASQKPDIKFHEEDWTKLEAMLDKASAEAVSARKGRWRAGISTVAGVLFLTVITYVLTQNISSQANRKPNAGVLESEKISQTSGAQGFAGAGKEIVTLLQTETIGKTPPEPANELLDPTHSLKTANGDAFAPSSRMANSKEGHHSKLTLGVETQAVAPTIRASTNAAIKSNSGEDRRADKTDKKNIKGEDGVMIAITKTALSAERHDLIRKDQVVTTREEIVKEPSADVDNVLNEPYLPAPQQETAAARLSNTDNDSMRHPEIEKADERSTHSKRVTQINTMPDSVKIISVAKDSLLTAQKKSAEEITPADERFVIPSRWSLLLSFSPDFSSNNLKRLTTPGEALGITGYYRISKNFSVLAGVIGSNKKYLSYGKEYKPNEAHYWSTHTNGVLPEEINGTCSMLEIPVGAQYAILHAKRSRLLVSGMLSSYIMFNESYAYTFETENPGATQGWKAKKTGSYPFSIAGVSLGYERDITTHLALGFSPYIKIPLREMGSWTSMRLYTIGAAFTVRYTLKKKKIPDRATLPHASD